MERRACIAKVQVQKINSCHGDLFCIFFVIGLLNPFTGDFDLPKRICLNGLFWFSFDKVRQFLSKFSTLVTSQKKVLFALSDSSKSVFEKCCSTNQPSIGATRRNLQVLHKIINNAKSTIQIENCPQKVGLIFQN
jgi:hypothetical protein